MSYRVRVQLQKGWESTNSKSDSSSSPLTASETISLINELRDDSLNYHNSDDWEEGLNEAIDSSIEWVEGFRGHGYSPSGDGDQHHEYFDYKKDRYRIDIGTFGGDGDGNWFK